MVSGCMLLTKEILEDIGYDDLGALDLLSNGSPLAGEIEETPIFKSQYKPCLMTMNSLCRDAVKRNQLILRLTLTSGDEELDKQMMDETNSELSRGWAEGPFALSDLEEGATISRRFALVQGSKVRMIRDFSISDLHLVDAFVATVTQFFIASGCNHMSSRLVGKTYDLKSAYRQVPIREDHLKSAYFSVYNHRVGKAEIYRLETLPFGATQRLLFSQIGSHAVFNSNTWPLSADYDFL